MKKLFIDEKACCGCGNCELVCSKGAIHLHNNIEGFLSPVIMSDRCIDCMACKNHCPVVWSDLNKEANTPIHTYTGYLSDDDVLKRCTSGGIATALAMEILSRGGVVYGVAYTQKYASTQHVRVTTMDELSKIRGTKYIQSEKGQIFRNVKRDVLEGKEVIFTGTPCEIGALKVYLQKEYSNLYTCDLICHGPTSSYLQNICIHEYEEKVGSELVEFSVRSKVKGWETPHLQLKYKDGSEQVERLYTSSFGRMFTNLCRESCYECRYKGDYMVSDITVGDYWGEKRDSRVWNPWGVSSILARTKKGDQLLHSLDSVRLTEIEYSKIAHTNPLLVRSKPRPSGRGYLGERVCKKGAQGTWKFASNKYKYRMGIILYKFKKIF